MAALLDVQDLNVRIPTDDGVIHAVRDVSFTVEPGEFFGVVGESGSGKSVLVQAIMGLIPRARVTGHAFFNGRDLLTLSPTQMRSLRGRDIGMVFQDPLSSLHPQFTVGWQIVEQIRAHQDVSKAEARDRAIDLLGRVGIPDPAQRFGNYPHQFSGGMRQRAMIAMALSLGPALVIADEPTTALDSTVQTQILDLLNDMREDLGVTVVMITHDLAVLGSRATDVMVMYAGRRLEIGPAAEVFHRPVHPYSNGLLASSPGNVPPGRALIPIQGSPPSLLRSVTGCVFADRCPERMPVCDQPPPLRRYSTGSQAACWLERPPVRLQAAAEADSEDASRADRSVVARVEGVKVSYASRRGQESTPVLRGIDLHISQGETVGLVGESGCGKSTLARVMAGLVKPDSGRVELNGRNVADLTRSEWRKVRREVQVVFQDPYGALNPRRRVGSIIGDPFRIHDVAAGKERRDRVRALMEVVGLNPEHFNRFPSQFSGGQRQRIGIARALALNPNLLILDEPVSALDVSVQAQVLNLLKDLQDQFDLSYLLISHDLAVVEHMCNRIAVMDAGRIIELATAAELYANPQEDFTKRLLAAAKPDLLTPAAPAPHLVSTTPVQEVAS